MMELWTKNISFLVLDVQCHAWHIYTCDCAVFHVSSCIRSVPLCVTYVVRDNIAFSSKRVWSPTRTGSNYHMNCSLAYWYIWNMIFPYVHMRPCYLCRLAFHPVSDNICSDNGLWPISAPGHRLNQCWFIVNWTPGKNPFKNVVCQNGGHFRSRADELRLSMPADGLVTVFARPRAGTNT